MNALIRHTRRLVWEPTPLDQWLLKLVIENAPLRLRDASRIMQRSVSQNVSRLKSHGYLDRKHGGTITPLPKALSYYSTHLRHVAFGAAMEPRGSIEPAPPTTRSPQSPVPRPVTVGSEGFKQEGPTAGEHASGPPGWGPEPPLDALVEALRSGQDPLLRLCNDKLRARVEELEAQLREADRRLSLARERLSFASLALG